LYQSNLVALMRKGPNPPGNAAETASASATGNYSAPAMETTVSNSASEPLRAAAAKLRTALALFSSGVAMKRAQLRRADSGASADEIACRMADWLRTRPGARYGDAEGQGRANDADAI
jgi:hypothetical protein